MSLIRDGYGLRLAFELVFLFIYEVASTTLVSLPPLIGLFFAYMVIEYHSKSRQLKKFTHSWYLSLVFLVFAQQLHGFYLASAFLAFIIFYYFIFDWLYVSLKYRRALLVLFVSAGYVLSWGTSSMLSYAMSGTRLPFGLDYVYYIALESALAMMFLKGRIA